MRIKYTHDEIIKRGRLGMALNQFELAIAMGYGYSTVQKWFKRGLPMIDGRITTSRAEKWLIENPVSPQPPPIVAHHRLLAAGKSCGRELKNGSRAASPQKAGRRREPAASRKSPDSSENKAQDVSAHA